MPNSVENTNTGDTSKGVSEQAADATTQPSVQVIDDVCVIVSNDAAGTLLAPVVVEKPTAGDNYSLLVEPGKKYFFNFEEGDVKSFTQKDGDLTVTFKDGSSIILENYAEATTSDAPAAFSFSDEFSASLIKVVDTTPDQEQLQDTAKSEKQADATDEAAQKVAAVEPAAGEATAEQLANIEPAAGDDAGGAGDRGGYGYQSSFDAQGVIPLSDVGPLGPTALQYGVNFRNDILFVEQSDDNPNIGDNPGIGSGIENVDETNGLPETVSGTVSIDFGDDGAGEFRGNGNFSTSLPLISHGVPVDVTETASGYVGMAGGVKVFEITINGNGDYEFTQFEPLDHADGSNPNDVITLDFGIIIFDRDEDQDTGSIQINIFDDGPAIVGDGTKVVDEDLLGPVTVGGNLVENFGEDGPGNIHPNGTSGATGDLANGVLTSGGHTVTITQTADGYVGTANGNTVFEVHIDPATGGYEFTLRQPLDHSVGGDTITLNFGAEIVDYDGDTASTNIVIDVTDSGPEIRDGNPQIGAGLENVDETNVLPETVNGTLPVDYGSDVPGTLGPNGSFNATTTLTSHGETVTVSPTANGYVGIANGVTVFQITIQANGDYSFTQFEPLDHPNASNPNDVISLNFGVQISDFDGDTDTGSIQINIFDDGPSISGDGAKSINENDIGPVSVNGNLVENFGEDGGGNIHTTGSTSYNGDYAGPVLTSNGVNVVISHTANGYTGTAGGVTVFEVTINPTTGAYTFTLHAPLDHSAGGSTISLHFGAEIVDYDGDTAQTEIVINVKDDVPNIGDNPGIGSGIGNIDETNVLPETVGGTVSIDFGNDGPGAFGGNGSFNASTGLTSHGTVVNVTQTATGYVGTAGGVKVFELTIQQNGGYSFTQFEPLDHPIASNPNDSIVLNFGIQISDSDGDTDTGNIRINIFDDGPQAVNDGAAVADLNPINGNVLTNDSHGEDGPGAVVSVQFNGSTTNIAPGGSVDINGTYGTLHISSDGAYTYTPYGGIDGTDQFRYTMDDYDNDQSSANLTISVDVDDQPILVQPETVTVDETNLAPTTSISDTISADFGTDGPGTFSGNGGFSGGPFTSEGHPVTVSFDAGTNTYTGTANGGAVFTLAIQSDGDYTFTLIGTLDHPVDGPTPADHDDVMSMQFGIRATDADGDAANGTITVNVRDDGPKANNDVNNFDVQVTNKDYNIVMVLDVSGSMDGNKLALLKSSVANLFGDFHDYNGGEIKVHIVPFATSAQTGQTFTLTDDASYTAAINFLNGLTANGTTNYEAPLQSAISWLQGATSNDPIAGADTYTYFVSDGEPNRYVNGSGVGADGSADRVMQEITGTHASDNVSEVTLLQSLSTQVIAVGIAVNGTTLDRLDIIDSNGTALDVNDPNDLDAILQGTNPITGQADGNVITGVNGGPGAIDLLSQDDDTTVTQIAFNGTTVNVHPVNGATINGEDGVLKIFANGSYTYTLSNGAIATNGAYHDQFVYTITDGDGDTSQATLTLNSELPEITVDVNVNNGVDSICVKEDGQGSVPVTASYNGGNGDEVMTLTLTGVQPTWVITAPGWVNQGGGTYTLTLPAGQTNYNGDITFKPPANSDVDMTGLNVKASVYDPDTGMTKVDNDGFAVNVDAVVDTPVLNASLNASYYWHKDYSHQVPLNVSSNVTDTDGSEVITKIVIKLNNPFSNAAGGMQTLDDMGVGLNKGTEVSPGVWEISVNAGNAAAALADLKLTIPVGGNGYWPIHQSNVGGHQASITIESHVQEKNLSGSECDYTDNDTVVIKCVEFCFYITPLAIDLDGDGVELVNVDAGVMFDMNNNGTLDKTSWVGEDDGFLTIDLNNDGVINNQSEFFGNSDTAEHGFANLAQYDSNGDGKIDAADEVFSKLLIWQDANQDGISQADELNTLAGHNITAINLNATETGTAAGDSFISHESTVLYADGSEGAIVDAWFNVVEGSTIGDGTTIAGTNAIDVIYGTENNDVLIGGLANDILFGGEGNDIFLFQSSADGADTIKDFEVGDVLDVSGLLTGYDALTDAINDFVFSTEANGNTTVYVDASGSGDIANATVFAILDGVTGLDVKQIVNGSQPEGHPYGDDGIVLPNPSEGHPYGNDGVVFTPVSELKSVVGLEIDQTNNISFASV